MPKTHFEILKNLDKPCDEDMWYRHSAWNIFKAIALLLEKNPKNFGEDEWGILHCHEGNSFVNKFKQILRTLENSIRVNDINAHKVYRDEENKKEYFVGVKSIDFVEWAIRKRFEVPEKMRIKIFQYNEIIDWEKLCKEQDGIIRNLKENIEEYKQKMAEKPIHHNNKKSYTRYTAALVKMWEIGKMGGKLEEVYNGNNMHNRMGLLPSLPFDIPCEDTILKITKEVRSELGLTETVKK